MTLPGKSAADEEPDYVHNPPPDPLLKPGAFIQPNQNAFDSAGRGAGSPTPIPKPGGPGDAETTPEPLNSVPLDQGPVPDWLPPGWRMELKVRAFGATAGTKDKYYFENATGHRCRSKKEVFKYLETGSSTKKRKAKSDNDNTSSSEKSNKPSSPVKPSIENFNFSDVPQKVRWEIQDSVGEKWRPIVVANQQVPENTQRQWASAFAYLTSQENVQQ